jgi:hypothetical protein
MDPARLDLPKDFAHSYAGQVARLFRRDKTCLGQTVRAQQSLFNASHPGRDKPCSFYGDLGRPLYPFCNHFNPKRIYIAGAAAGGLQSERSRL